MAQLVKGENLSAAWLEAMTVLLGENRGKTVNLNVVFSAAAGEDPAVRAPLDAFLTSQAARQKAYGVNTVASTIFPKALYRPELGPRARDHLYELNALAMQLQRRRRPGDRDTY